jgi:hypothetical protein
MKATINRETGSIYSRQQLLDAFNVVANKANWKYPIYGEMIPEKDRDITKEAIIFFTGSAPSFRQVSNHFAPGYLIVTADGYYKTCGA